MPVESRDAKIQQNVHLDPIDKRENDNKEYRAIRLPNGLEALLISNENLTTSSQEKKASCSLCVNVGNFSDPPEFPGISYFLHYKLFQDLEKSSEQCTLDKYIENHKGINDISVDNEHTIFFFDIEENSLFVALKRFGDFFVEPIISEQVLIEQYDVQNVLIYYAYIEFQRSLRKRQKRYDQLFSSFAQTGHPANKFSVDHLIKLRNNIDYNKLYNVLDKFKSRHYSAHRMKLAIRSGLSLDVMEKFVTSCFANMSNNGISPDNFSKFKNDLPFDTPAFRKMYKVKDNWEHLTRVRETKFEQISVQLTTELTSEGLKHLEDILDAIFSFINLLKRAGPQKEIYNDMYESKKDIYSGVLMDIYCELWKPILAEELYPASLAGFIYDINILNNGFTLKISGLNETLPLVAATFAQNMVQYSSFITEDIFENAKARKSLTYFSLISSPATFTEDMALSILKLDHHSLIDMYNIIQNITFKDFQGFVKSFTEHLYIQCLVQGNMTPSAAINTVEQFINTINCSPLHPNTIKQLRGTQIPLGISYYKIKNITKYKLSLVTNYYQAGVTTIELSTLIHLISYIMDHKLSEDQSFEKFWYTNVNFRNINGILGYSITVYTQYTIEYIDRTIDRFLNEFKNDMEELTEKELDVYKETFLKSRSFDDANLEKENERNWKEIITCTYMFDLNEQEIHALEKINVNKLREWLADHTMNGNNFRKLSLQVVGTTPKKAKYVNLTNINDDYQYNPNRYHYITKN
ncbi:PREDICTED: uncharacterized protein LOC105143897 [Acromyrmex echinatior]|uniref:uncharacterized protein LOC105143897 n=1 Tax=Acromyrmex echinatior TaxID=103372 RepID=UPI000580FD21|nr:PREDICTED: uncharacterized protein LOC105143897 [Acromyrmex echinatior]